MSDEEMVQIDDTVVEQPVESHIQPETKSESPATPGLSADDIASLRSQIASELRSEFSQQLETVKAQAQSFADRKRNEAIRKAKLVDEMSQTLGLDAEQVSAAKRAIIESTFYADEPEPTPQIPQPQMRAPTSEEWEASIIKAAKEQGFSRRDPELMAILDEAEQIKANDPQAREKWNALVDKQRLAKAKRKDAEALHAAKVAEAQKQKAEIDASGGLGAASTSGAPLDKEKELQRLLNNPPTDPRLMRAYQEKLAELSDD